MSVAVPIKVIDAGGAVVPNTSATFFWLDGGGGIAKAVTDAPIQNNVALYDGPPLPHGAFWGITVNEPGGLPIFRSGRLAKLPGPPSQIVVTSHIDIFRASTSVSFGIDSPDGASDLVRQRLAALPASVRVDSVRFTGDSAGHEVVTVAGRRRILFFLSWSFTYTLSLTLRPATAPGHPEDVVIVERTGPGSATGSTAATLSSLLDQPIMEGVKKALEAAIRRIATLEQQRLAIPFPATLVSLTALTVHPHLSGPTIEMRVHGSTIGGLSGTMTAA